MKVKTSKGFTLAELLIVMAIIVVLAAIAIPTFGKQLETARESADAEAIRAAATDAYTEAYMKYAKGSWAAGEDTSGHEEAVDVVITQKVADFAYAAPTINIGGQSATVTTCALTNNQVKFTFLPDGNGGIKLKDASSVVMATKA